jgi:ABC-type multidrug transport system fused ATPase/permease subunit
MAAHIKNNATLSLLLALYSLSAVRTVKTHAAEEEMSRRYAVHLREYRRLSMLSAAVYFPFSALTYTFLPYCASCLVLYYGGQLVDNDHLANGELVSFVFYMQSLFATFSSLGSIYVGLVQAVGAADKVYEWCYRDPKATTPPAGEGIRPADCRGEVEVRGVSFRYPQRPDRLVLDDLSLRSPPGKVLALCGPSGGGKSSVMALLQNWYEPEQGDIYLDGVSIRALDQQWVSEQSQSKKQLSFAFSYS